MLFMIPLLLAGGIVYAGVRGHQKNQSTRKNLQNPQEIVLKNTQAPATEEPVKVENSIVEMEKQADKYFAVSQISLALSTAGALVYPPLSLVSIPCLVYMSIPFWEDGYKSLVVEKQIRMSVLDSIVLPGYVLTRNYFAGSLAHFFYFLSRKILIKTEDHSRQSLISIFGEQPRAVWILKEAVEIEIPFEELQVGDIMVVNAGETVPVDGTIIEGIASINQQILTGESQPVEKEVGETVLASTMVLSGRIYLQVEKAGRDTVAAQIIDILNKTADFKTSIQSRGERIADSSAVPSLALGMVALILRGGSSSLAVINSSIGYNMRITAPLSMLNFLQIASHQGILVKDGRSLDLLSQVDTVVFDKTGTLTLEQPHVGNIYTCGELSEAELLKYAAAAEYKQTHPIAKAILQQARERQLVLPEIHQAKYEVGYGIKVNLADQIIRVGSARFMELEGITIPTTIQNVIREGHEQGHSLILVAINEQLGGAIELHATIREEVKAVISELRQHNLSIWIISGDHEKPTKNLAEQLGIDHYFAESLPENKAQLIKQLQDQGRFVCYVGDGINDSIALKQANVSISMRGAATIATDTAQIVLMEGNLHQLGKVFEIAKQMDTNMKNGFLITIVPGVICIGGAFFFGFGVLSSIILFNVGLIAGVSNSMLPLLEHDSSKDPESKTEL